MEAVGDFGLRIDVDALAGMETSESFVELFVYRRVKRVPRPDEDRIEVRILVKVLLVKRELAIGRVGLADPSDAFAPFGAQVSENVLDAPEAVGPRLDLESDLLRRLEKLHLDILRHQSALFGLYVRFQK